MSRVSESSQRIIREIMEQADLAMMPLANIQALTYRVAWLLTARDDQLPPLETDEDWFIWLLMAGRGSGKTRVGAEDSWQFGYENPGARIAIVAPTSNDCRKTCFEGESGLIACIPPLLVSNWNRGELTLTMQNGTIFQGYSAEEPDRLRGPQHHRGWCDEMAAWRYLDATLDNLLMGLRLGRLPRIVATTTPRPIKRLREILAERRNEIDGRPGKEGGTTHVATVSTYANRENLPKIFLETILKRYEGTRLGLQELHAKILDDTPGALWTRTNIENNRTTGCAAWVISPVTGRRVAIVRMVVGVDPATTSGPDADEHGIVLAGLGEDGRGYVFADASRQGTPLEWGEAAVRLYDEWGGDRVVYETNQGGEMVLLTITTSASGLKAKGERDYDFVSTQGVHASRGKVTRAEPVSALYEKEMVSHVGMHPVLEDQMCEFTTDFDRNKAGYSPDRVDALVWALTHLMLSAATDGTNVRDHYRREHSEMVERARNGGAAPRMSDTGRTVLLAPPGVSVATGMLGDSYVVNERGEVHVLPQDVGPLTRAGFREAETA